MHDLDRTQLEFEPEEGLEFEDRDFEFDAGEGPFSEEEEMDLAAQLMEITDEAELDQFLGKLIKKAGRFMKSPVGRAVGGILKGVAKKVLPIAGGALGSLIAPGVGTAIGTSLGTSAGKMFGLELEGLSPEDQEYEVTRRFVRLAGTAAKNAATASPDVDPKTAARTAVVAAARRHAPGLLQGITTVPTSTGISGRSGRWIRRGRKIILLGV